MNMNSLNSIIQLRQLREDELKNKLVKIKGVIAEHERSIHMLEEEFAKKVQEAMDRKHSEIEAEALRDFHDYLEGLTKVLQEKRSLLERRIQELKQTEKTLWQAYQEKKMMESLKEKIIQQRQDAARRAEVKELDALGIRRLQQ